MENLVWRSKYVVETISILVDFSDVLPAGTSIQGTPTVSISLQTGYDPSPTGILYLGTSVHGGTVAEQRFRLGVPGVIYEITWQAYNGAEYFQKTNFLAILPNVGNAPIDHVYLYETSCLYPYQLVESLTSNIAWAAARIGYFYSEGIVSNISWFSGALAGGLVAYSIPPEGLTSNIVWLAGIVGGHLVTYAIPHEDMQSNVAWISGLIGGTGISYAIPHEDLQSNIQWVSGSVV